MYPVKLNVKLKLIGPGTAEGMAAVTRAKQYIREQFPHL